MDLRSQKRKSFLGGSGPRSGAQANMSFGSASQYSSHANLNQSQNPNQSQNVLSGVDGLNGDTPGAAAAPAAPPPDLRMKLVCVGDGGSGKTSLLIRYTRGDFPEEYVPTIFENYVNVVRRRGKIIELALWDTAGQEEYDRLRALSYPESDIIVVCFSIDNPISLANVHDKWIPEVSHYCPGVPYLLVGLKSDMRGTEPLVTIEEALEVGLKSGAASYIECSAKSGENVDKVFSAAIRIILNPHERPILKDATRMGIRIDGGSGPTTESVSNGFQTSNTANALAYGSRSGSSEVNTERPGRGKPKRSKRHCLIL